MWFMEDDKHQHSAYMEQAYSENRMKQNVLKDGQSLLCHVNTLDRLYLK